MRRVQSREYKIMLRRARFSNLDEGLIRLRRELDALTRAFRKRIRVDKRFKSVSERRITFFDTSERILSGNELVLRQRVEKKKLEYTLKCRSPDRYVAAAKSVGGVNRLKPKEKFEEDIGPPFRSRFAHSCTVTIPQGEGFSQPETVREAAEIFPLIGRIRSGKKKWLDTPFQSVGGWTYFEQVHTGAVFTIAGQTAEIAAIFWSKKDAGRILLVEFSFRYGSKQERYPVEVAEAAQELFASLQESKWFDPDARTKTQIAFES